MSFTAWPYPPPIDDLPTSCGVQDDRFTINGRIQHLRGFTDFAGFDVWRRTGQLSPLALRMQQIHHDFVSLSIPALTPRILLIKNSGSLFDLDPRYPEFISDLERHASLMNQARFVPLYVLLADCAAFGNMSLGWQQDHVGRCCEVLRHHVCWVELANEYDNGPQQIDPSRFQKPDGVCISRGSPAEKGPIAWPPWDFITTRYRRDRKWLQTISDSAYAYRNGEQDGPSAGTAITIPFFDSEPVGAGEEEGKRYTSTERAFQLGCESALHNHAALLHWECGLTSAVPGPVQTNIAITFLRGVMAVPEVP